MICNKCNKEIEDGAKFCTHCGEILAEGEKKAPTVISVAPKKRTVKKTTAEKKEEKPTEKITEEKKEETAPPILAQETNEEAVKKPTRAKKTTKKSAEEKKEECAPSTLAQEANKEAVQKPSDKKEEKSAEKAEGQPTAEAVKTEKNSSKKEKKAVAAPEKTEEKMTEETSPVLSSTEEKNEKPKEEKAIDKKKKAPKSKDRVNFFLLLLTLCCPPYFGVLITICKSAKAPKASQVYGVFTILSFIFSKIKGYILTAILTFCVIIAALVVLLSGAYIIFTELGYDISFVTDAISGLFNM